MRGRLKRIRGMTLVEMLVTSTLGLLLIGSVMGLLSLGRSVWQDTEANIATLQDARKALNQIAYDVSRSSWRDPADGGPPDPIEILNEGTEIRFQIPQNIVGNNITWGDRIVYRVNENGQLTRLNITTGETRIIANDINSIVFGTLPSNANVITVSITARKTSLSTRQAQNVLQTNITVRN